jgi:hydroxyacylglutathione hydrolase
MASLFSVSVNVYFASLLYPPKQAFPPITTITTHQPMTGRKAIQKVFGAFTVDVVPVLKDNFSYIITDPSTNAMAFVDVSEVAPLLHLVEGRPSWIAETRRSPRAPMSVLSTHKHWDHSGGNKDVAAKFPDVVFYAGEHEAVPHKTHDVKHGDSFRIGSLTVDAYHTPCHTSGHMLFHVYHPESRNAGAVFTGDTVFAGGIGAFFEGNSELMLRALEVFADLPDGTSVFPGHDYTLNFLKFAATVVPKDAFIAAQCEMYAKLKAEGMPSVPTTVAEEKKQNVFLRVLDPAFRAMMGKEDSIALMQHLYDTCP